MRRRDMLLGSVLAVLGSTRALAFRLPAKAHRATGGSPVRQLKGKIVFKGDAEYEGMREFGIFNARKPNRYPEAIVMAESVDDVIAAVKLAKAKGWQVGVRSGGHSWVAPHTRDKAILINLVKMQEMSVDPDKRIATVSPAVEGQALNALLQDQYKLMFPSAHGVGVGLGGFVMCGGHGWNSRNWGPGCANLRALDVVTADGELIHASETENTDYLWAARGSGAGFFGAAVRYYLDVHPMPPVMKRSAYVFPIDVLESLTTWVNDNAPGFPKGLEIVMIGKAPEGAPIVILSATAMAESEAEADALLDLLDGYPDVAKAISHKPRAHAQLPYRFEPPTESMPAGYRFAIDNIWTSAPSAELTPLMRELFTNFPTPKSYIFWQCWGPPHNLPNMAYTVEGNVYIAANAVYTDAADDARCDAWASAAMSRLAPVSVGSQMNDENMKLRRSRYLSEAAAAKLETLRAKYDPEHRFVSFLTA